MRILFAEDDKRLSKMIDFLLKKENYIVDCVYNGQDAIDYANLSDYDIIILDWMMPLKSGIEVCRYLRAKNNQTAILMLTARDSLEDKIDGLDSGADDYLAKPFEFPELLARIRALSRRINKTFYNDIIEYNNLKLNCCNAILTYKQIEVSLSPRENQLMELLIRNTHQILPREQIIDKIWGYDTNINSNTLDVTIKSLRQKLTKLSLSDCIHTIRGIGYKFEMDIYMFTKFKEKIVKDYCYLTVLLLLFVSFSLYIVGFSISYKSQLSHIKMLAIEESEDLFYKINTKDLKNFPKDDDNSPEEDNYFNKIFIYGYTKDHQLVFEHNNMEWSEKSITKIINDNSLSFHKVYFDFNLVDNRHLKYLIYMRYPLLENNVFLGEVYVGIEITHWVREQIRIFFILLIIISLSLFFVRYVAYKMANKAMQPVVQSFEQQKQFIANASHELRTPLSIIMSGLTVLKTDDENNLSKFSIDTIDDINDESLKMKKLIDNLLLSARNTNNTLTVHSTKFNLNNLINKIYTKFSLLAKNKQITLKISNPPDIFITADMSHIEQILAILVDNAIKYSDENSSIFITITEDKQCIKIAIKDSGPGISIEDLPHIFKPFYRANNTRTYYGNGLGLSIAQILAQKNHSNILVENNKEKGSCFTLIISKN